MEYELLAEFSNDDIASIALHQIQQTIPFIISEHTTDTDTIKTSLDAFSAPATPVFISAVNFPTLIPSEQPNQSIYRIRLIGQRRNCKRAAEMLREMGAQNVHIHSL